MTLSMARVYYTECKLAIHSVKADSSRMGRDTQEVITAAAVELVNERGLTAVAMSHVAERAGITRPTLYKYFPDVRAILVAWQEQRVSANLVALTAARDAGGPPRARLERMLEAYGLQVREQHTPALSGFLHSTDHAVRGYAELTKMLRSVLAEGARSGDLRHDVPPAELASFCISALATPVSSTAAARRLVRVVMSALVV